MTVSSIILSLRGVLPWKDDVAISINTAYTIENLLKQMKLIIIRLCHPKSPKAMGRTIYVMSCSVRREEHLT